jgi:hypothetical protein
MDTVIPAWSVTRVSQSKLCACEMVGLQNPLATQQIVIPA